MKVVSISDLHAPGPYDIGYSCDVYLDEPKNAEACHLIYYKVLESMNEHGRLDFPTDNPCYIKITAFTKHELNCGIQRLMSILPGAPNFQDLRTDKLTYDPNKKINISAILNDPDYKGWL